MKMQISVDDKLAERIDKYASENYMSRSGLISFACSQYLNQVEAISAISEMGIALRKIAETGKCDEETLKQLEDIERVCKFMMQGK